MIDRSLLAGVGTAEGTPSRPEARGKFLFLGNEKFYVKGVTYGAFRPDASGNEFHDVDQIDRDFSQMAANGINSVRIPHTMPPVHLLDIAMAHGLKVMVGLSAEQYVGYLIDKKGAPNIEQLVRDKLRDCAGHPAILCYALGNEIPAPSVRWLGRAKVERYLRRLYEVVKEEDPEGLVTYVNYPTTEYLDLSFLDLTCFNVYLERQDDFEAYLGRLHNLCEDRPLLMSEIGLDSIRNGELMQARSLDWQLKTSFALGCAGTFVFSWTDEWHRGEADVEDWAFGLTDRQRKAKPALSAVRKALKNAPFASRRKWPRVSVVICCYNGEEFIRDCLEGVSELAYPAVEVIVVNDGSTDRTSRIVEEFGFTLINTPNRGLSSARNTGCAAATGEIVAYLDSDARPDPHWLHYLVETFERTDHVGVGGPNIAPPDDGLIAEGVANAPGGPMHVLLSDSEAEHIPGCNMAIRKSALEKIDGFDPQFRAAGDDVDVCWRLQEEGWTLGFSASAVVWHHRRNSVRDYWKQQKGYGKAEALLEAKWPQKYNRFGHLTWTGRIYGRGVPLELGRVSRIYHGVWGLAPFQRLYEKRPATLFSSFLMPEWWLAVLVLGLMSAAATLWMPLLIAVPLLAGAIGVVLSQAVLSGARVAPTRRLATRADRIRLSMLTTVLYLIQPIARLSGRLNYGLKPWCRLRARPNALPMRRSSAFWTEQGQDPYIRLAEIQKSVRREGAVGFSGGEYDSWDLEVRGGPLAGARLLMAAEDHGGEAQFVRFRSWPVVSRLGLAAALLLGASALWAASSRAWLAAAIFAAVTLTLAVRATIEAAAASSVLLRAVGRAEQSQ